MFVSHGDFFVKNNTDSSTEVLITNSSFYEDSNPETLDSFYIYTGDGAQALDNPFVLSGLETKEVRITFPAKPVRVSGKKTYKLSVEFLINGQKYTSDSIIKLVMEK